MEKSNALKRVVCFTAIKWLLSTICALHTSKCSKSTQKPQRPTLLGETVNSEHELGVKMQGWAGGSGKVLWLRLRLGVGSWVLCMRVCLLPPAPLVRCNQGQSSHPTSPLPTTSPRKLPRSWCLRKCTVTQGTATDVELSLRVTRRVSRYSANDMLVSRALS